MLHQACIMHSWRDACRGGAISILPEEIAAEHGQERKPGAVLFAGLPDVENARAMAGMCHIDAPPTLCP
jgi:hypothetical protein